MDERQSFIRDSTGLRYGRHGRKDGRRSIGEYRCAQPDVCRVAEKSFASFGRGSGADCSPDSIESCGTGTGTGRLRLCIE